VETSVESLNNGKRAWLLTSGAISIEDSNLIKLIGFFGIASRTTTVSNFLNYRAMGETEFSKRLVCSSDALFEAIESIDRCPDGLPDLARRIHSIFVYAGENLVALRKLLGRLIGDLSIRLDDASNAGCEWKMAADQADFCGALSGVSLTVRGSAVQLCHLVNTTKSNATSIISNCAGTVFLKLDWNRIPVFLSLCQKVIDIETEVTSGNFDIRDHLMSAAPGVLYTRWAFGAACWNPPETYACLVLDDPSLKEQYGFVNFRRLLMLMKRHDFTTSIAFIPWNWRRSDPQIIRLFKENPERYSISVHGCDHTAGEFGIEDQNRLLYRARQAHNRMCLHQTKTGLRHDPIMVFPQGVFSKEAIGVLKRTNFHAVVNTEVICSGQRVAIRIADLWDVAVMNYDSFPIYTRRYPSEGIENFAFDIVLGKPCIAVVHQDFCRDKYRHLLEFIKRLNGLNCSLSWRSLSEVVRSSWRQRVQPFGLVEIEMYGTQLRVENHFNQRAHYRIIRREHDRSAIKTVRVGSIEAYWDFCGDYLRVETDVEPGGSITIGIEFEKLDVSDLDPESVSYRIKSMFRRYLSEARDNYLIPVRARFFFSGS
jgi:hypothetical protein